MFRTRWNNVEIKLYQRCFNVVSTSGINVVQRWKSDVGFCFIFNVGSTLFQRWSTTLKQRWSNVEMWLGFFPVVLVDICNCSYLNCYNIFCILIWFLQKMFLFAYSSVHKLSFFLSLLLGYHIMAHLMHKWKPLKLLSMHILSFLFW